MFNGFDHRNTEETAIVSLADTNGDNVVDFEEWFAKLKEYFTLVFKEMDKNNDGSLLDETKEDSVLQKFSLNFFQDAAKHVVDFFDSNNDDAVALDDSFFEVNCRRHKNKDGDCSLSDVLDTSLISLPAPLYNLYSRLDQDRNEKLSLEEAMDFIQRTFAAIDGNLDCHIDEEEIVSLLRQVGLPGHIQLAVKMILQQYLTIGRYLVHEFIQRAGTNQDDQVTIQDVFAFTDWDFIDEQIPAVATLGHPGGSIDLLLGGRRQSREESEKSLAMWLTALQVSAI